PFTYLLQETTNKGLFPIAALVQGSDGNVYGTTSDGGANYAGTVFKMTPPGALTILVEFTGNATSNKGAYPAAGLAQGSDGNFYGTTAYGGIGFDGQPYRGNGTVFKMTPAGELTTLVEFTGDGPTNKGTTVY